MSNSQPIYVVSLDIYGRGDMDVFRTDILRVLASCMLTGHMITKETPLSLRHTIDVLIDCCEYDSLQALTLVTLVEHDGLDEILRRLNDRIAEISTTVTVGDVSTSDENS